MCEEQPVQIDCRITTCKYYRDGKCIHPSPVITPLTFFNKDKIKDKMYGCWSVEEINR
jgi:hypothetical protein